MIEVHAGAFFLCLMVYSWSEYSDTLLANFSLIGSMIYETASACEKTDEQPQLHKYRYLHEYGYQNAWTCDT